MAITERIPFAEAVGDPHLLGRRFAELSLPQQVVLRSFYGCPLSATTKDAAGWSELDYWAALQEQGTADELGYLTSVRAWPYTPQTYRELWAIIGRRGGKSDAVAATVMVYEATMGGHTAHLRSNRQAVCFLIAQDLRLARYALHGLRATLECSPILAREIVQVTADRIDLKNGITLATVPPTTKSVRGYDCPAAVLDEVSVWSQATDSANPDFEVYRALTPGMAQFPDSKLVGISSPWNKAGLLYRHYQAGTNGVKLDGATPREDHQGVLVLHGSTALLANPKISRARLATERATDPKAYEREYLAIFHESVSGFLPTVLIDMAIDRGRAERPALPRFMYVAALDPGFRHDAFGFTIVHADPELGIVQDVVRRWYDPRPGALSPSAILGEIADLCQPYGVQTVYSDQYQFEALNQLAQQRGLWIEMVNFTATSKAKLYGNLQQLVRQKRLRLLDDAEQTRELKGLERTLSPMGTLQVRAPEGQHDDLATVLAIAAHKAVPMLPLPEVPASLRVSPTDAELCMTQALTQRTRVAQSREVWD